MAMSHPDLDPYGGFDQKEPAPRPTTVEEKATEFRRHIENANVCIRELIEMGARPEIDKHDIVSMKHPDAFILIPRTMLQVRDV